LADDIDLERRLDKIEAWREAEAAVKAEREAETTARHTRSQMTMSIISTLTMLVNLYLTVSHFR
jgi:hypothetical protein